MIIKETLHINKYTDADSLKKLALFQKNHSPHYEIHFSQTAIGKLNLDQSILPLQKGELYIIPPGINHALFLAAEEREQNYFIFNVMIEDDAIIEAVQLYGKRPVILHPEKSPNFFKKLHYQLNHPHPLMKRAGTYQLTALLCEALVDHKRELNIPKTDNPRILHCIELMHLNIFTHFSLKETCDEMEISEEYLIRLFRKETDMTPMTYFRKLKIETAQNLMHDTGLSIKEIAWQLKFTDQYHFSRVFKKIVGENPSAYKKKMNLLD